VPITTTDFEFVRTLVKQRAAIVLESQKAYLAENRLTTLARDEGYSSIEDLLNRLRKNTDPALQQKVIEAMTTNETYFFRDVHPFEMLKNSIVPKLIQQRSSAKTLNVWSAACSTGQEGYTIAMCLNDSFPEIASWNISILGTDISLNVLEKARAGRYTSLEVNRGLPARYLAKYFTKEHPDWFVKDEIRRMVSFKEQNLISPWPIMPRFDVVFLRNVLIYFDVATKKEILRKVRTVMNQDGFLLLGGAETTLSVDETFERIDFGQGSCYQIRSQFRTK
jgi:chemotaxis protein methyltransferase CheR